MAASVEPFVCPWPCVASSSPEPIVVPNVVSTRSFAQALVGVGKVGVDVSPLPKPCLKGNSFSIKISEAVYQSGLANCNNYLHGRLILARGDKPVSFKDLRDKLMSLWKSIGQWKMVPMGRGFYEFRFSCAEDLRTVWSSGAWNLNPGLLRLSRWSPDFHPSNQKQTHSQVWVRFHYLPLEYWQPRILFEIAGAIGTPIIIDQNTLNQSFGHYARVLVDINMAGFLPDTLWVERENFTFDIEIEYEKRPYFCFTCNSIGHSSDHCKKDHANKIALEKVVSKNDPVKNNKHVFIPKRNVAQVQGCSKHVAFEDPLITDIIRSREVIARMPVEDVLNLEKEIPPSISVETDLVQPIEVEDTTDLANLQGDDHQISNYPDMLIVGQWSDAVTDLDYTQDYCQDSTTSDLEQNFGSDRRQLVLGAPPIPVAVQRDMDFLRQSRDNMAEVDVNQPFQMVVSKKKKKNQKQQAEASKGTYPTRFRVSTSKCFQLKL
jgi:hypothetical protein